MVRQLFLLLAIISFLKVQAQNVQINYDVYKHETKHYGILVSGADSSYYKEKTENEKTIKTQAEEIYDGEVAKVIKTRFGSKLPTYVFYDSEEKGIKCIEFIGGFQGSSEEQACYIDDIPTMEWEIQEDTQVISGFTCYKATTNFRGNEFEVWFTPELPIRQGPWKFNNLPGAILQAYTKDKNYSWNTTKLIYDIEAEVLPSCDDFEVLSYEEFVEKDIDLRVEAYKEDQKRELRRKYGNKINFNFEVDREDFRYNNLELKFEWED